MHGPDGPIRVGKGGLSRQRLWQEEQAGQSISMAQIAQFASGKGVWAGQAKHGPDSPIRESDAHDCDASALSTWFPQKNISGMMHNVINVRLPKPER